MTERSAANLEMAIILPLGVVANQLMRMEADLRLLNMKAMHLVQQRGDGGDTRLIAARLDQISEVLDSIRVIVRDMEADIQPRPTRKPAADRDD
jgi:hypothetical protein